MKAEIQEMTVETMVETTAEAMVETMVEATSKGAVRMILKNDEWANYPTTKVRPRMDTSQISFFLPASFISFPTPCIGHVRVSWTVTELLELYVWWTNFGMRIDCPDDALKSILVQPDGENDVTTTET